MQQSNHHFSFTIVINSNLNTVWQTLIDVQNWHKWDTELIKASLDEDFGVGAKGVLIPKTGPKLKFYISEITPNGSYTFNIIMPIGELIIKRSLSSENGKINFTDEIYFTGILKTVYGLILGGQFRKVLPDVMNKFKILAESK